eukprot:TRINITY_DN183_c0_g1_i2.p1 TRINITY_DN183_c0_g1~~TRINITY_DN183_c0_g1_i2.p1  ORF type:complete len:165 (-),score=51.07 TRINITY_DN183_c0_g1_i2:91-585(-)
MSHANPVAPELDLTKYVGKWYEIATIVKSFEKGLVGNFALYEFNDSGTVDIMNAGFRNNFFGPLHEVHGTLAPVELPSKFKVTFNLLFGLFHPTGDYWVSQVGPVNSNGQYSYSVVVSGNTKEFCWILSRTPQMDDTLYNSLIQLLVSYGFDASRITKTPQQLN